MKVLNIIGAGGHGRVAADIAQSQGYSDIRFFDSAFPDLKQSGIWPVLGHEPPDGDDAVAVAIGNNTIRMRRLESIKNTPVTLIHPSAVVSPNARIGAGCVICAGTVVGAFATLGAGCILNTGASVDHDCLLGDGVHISPGARLGGGVTVGARSWVGIGAVVREYLTIGSDVMVGAGAALVQNVPNDKRIGGVPAKEF